ncbi:MAG: sigma-70 family RNA polymerase sigma factor [Dehalococcoidia bacterium]|nr:sigma-70 family RNA polymerase sigma factor [Dehalococcoidia bacterium]
MTSPARPRGLEADPALDDLVRRAQRGDLAAFNAIVLRTQDAVYGLALRMLARREAAEDVTQEAFVAAWRRIDTFRGGSFRSWLFTIAANRARDELRRGVRRPATSLDAAHDDPDRTDIDPPDRDPGPQAAAEQAEMRAALEAALAELPPDWREVVVLSDIHGLDYAEIAQVTGVALGTVKSRLSRARARLREVVLASRELSEAAQRLSDRR